MSNKKIAENMIHKFMDGINPTDGPEAIRQPLQSIMTILCGDKYTVSDADTMVAWTTFFRPGRGCLTIRADYDGLRKHIAGMCLRYLYG